MSETCPCCDAGKLTDHVEQRPAVWEGREGTVPLQYSTCDNCGSELVNENQAAANKIAILDFRNGQ